MSPLPPGPSYVGGEVSPLVAQLLYNRGISDPSQHELFLAADQRLAADPFLLPDMPQAVSRIYHALLAGENIAIYGDFDADGITATALLVEGLSALGGNVIPYIPHRVEEGYGLGTAALKGLYQEGITLVITVDCGISALDEVRQAREMGLDIIISDHHTVLSELPPAIAVVDPKRPDSTYPFSGLAGVGVAYKILQALLSGRGREEILDRTTDLVALGTVVDMVPLLSENRYLVKQGLNVLNSTTRFGIQEMIRLSKSEPGRLDTKSISWELGPRLNASGRMEHAISGYQILVTSSPEEAGRLALDLEQKNAERQRLTNEVLSKAREKVLPSERDAALLMVGDSDYAAGVIGIVASRLVEEFYRPTVVFQLGPEASRGSGRSIPDFDLIAALMECSDLLNRFGGHPMAAGFTVPTENIKPLKERLIELAARQLKEVDLRPHLAIDAEVLLSSLGGETFATIQRLAPFGTGNPVPTFLSRKVKVVNCQNGGTQGEHLRLRFREGKITWHAIGFGLGGLAREVAPYIDIVYNLEIDDWGGEQTLQLNILDFAPSQ